VPTRHSTGLGWTHQLGYILAHRAQIEGGNINRSQLAQPPCSGCSKRAKHYVVLHDTFDSYEGWDTLDNVPLKLAWVRETASFFEFSLCLSRACLGKTIVFTYKWLRNAVPQGIWAYNHAAFSSQTAADGRIGASYRTPDGQYLSWANSWSEVYNPHGGGAKSFPFLSHF
jgi:hypothetical protein